jgi:hypothetical protein
MTQIKMIEFSKRFGISPWKLHRRLAEFETINVEGFKKPWIVLSENNIRLAMLHANTRMVKAKKPRLTIEEYCNKYRISSELIFRWHKSLIKEKINQKIYIADVAQNRKLLGIKNI